MRYESRSTAIIFTIAICAGVSSPSQSVDASVVVGCTNTIFDDGTDDEDDGNIAVDELQVETVDEEQLDGQFDAAGYDDLAGGIKFAKWTDTKNRPNG